MNRIVFGLILAGLAPAAFSETAPANTEDVAVNVTELKQSAGLESVDSIRLMTRLDGWTAVDRDTLILWATPFRPYLIELDRASPDLPFVETIGVTSTTNEVRAKFDSVRIRGMSYPIRGIFKLTRDEARDFKREQ
jgi:hypothetical protein